MPARTKKLVYIGPHRQVQAELVAVGRWDTAINGEPVEVDEKLAEGFLAQTDNWRLASDTNKKKSSPSDADTTPEEG